MIRMGLVKRKASTKKPTMTEEQFQQRKDTFLKQVSSLASCHHILSSLVINWDQSCSNLYHHAISILCKGCETSGNCWLWG